MPNYSSKSQKRSQSQSKNGGRRRKRTLKNVRRRKSRKVMMGGGVDVKLDMLGEKLDTFGGKNLFLEAMSISNTNFDEWKTTYMNSNGKDTVDLSKMKDVIKSDSKYLSVRNAIDELIAKSN